MEGEIWSGWDLSKDMVMEGEEEEIWSKFSWVFNRWDDWRSWDWTGVEFCSIIDSVPESLETVEIAEIVENVESGWWRSGREE